MRNSMIVAGLIAGLLATPALAEPSVVVLDTNAAMMATDVAKKADAKLQGEIKVQVDRIGQLSKELEALEAKYKKDAAVMSEQDKKNVGKQFESKAQELQNLKQAVEKRGRDVLNDLIQRLAPKMDTIVKDMQKANKYDLILHRQAAVFVDGNADITKKVTERLNAAMAAPAK